MEQIGLEAVFRDENFQSGMKKYTDTITQADTKTTKVAGSMSKAMSGFAHTASTALGSAIGTLTGNYIPKMVSGFGDMIKSAAEAEKTEKALDAVLEATAGSAGVTKKAVLDLANGYSKLTTFEDDTIVAAQTVLLRFKEINSETFPRATELTLDLAQALGRDASSAAELLGKALEDPTQGIARLRVAGVSLTDEQEKLVKSMVEAGDTAGAQKLIMDELAKSIGGAAKAAGQTAQGQWTILQNQLGNMGETIGAAFLPVLTELTKSINVNVLPAFQAWADKNMPAITDALKSFGTLVADMFPLVSSAITTAWGIIGPTLTALGTWLTGDGIKSLQAFFDKVRGFQPLVQEWSTWMGDMLSITQATTGAMNLNFGVEFPSMVEIVRNAMESIKTYMTEAMGFMRDLQLTTTSLMAGDWSNFFDNLVMLFGKVWNLTLPGIITNAARAIGQAIASALMGPINAVIDQINSLVGQFDFLGDNLPRLPSHTSTSNATPAAGMGSYDLGGWVNRTGPALVHAGEYVLNPMQARLMAPVLTSPVSNVYNYSFNHNWNGNAGAMDRREIERIVETATYRSIRQVVGAG